MYTYVNKIERVNDNYYLGATPTHCLNEVFKTRLTGGDWPWKSVYRVRILSQRTQINKYRYYVQTIQWDAV